MDITKHPWFEGLKEHRNNFIGIWLGAISLTVVGDSAFSFLSQLFNRVFTGNWNFDRPSADSYGSIVLFVAASAGLFYAASLVEVFARVSEKLGARHRAKETPGWKTDVPPSPALIAFVSKPNPDFKTAGKSHESAVDSHLNPMEKNSGKLKYLRLVASDDEGSINAANDYRNIPALADLDVDVISGINFNDLSQIQQVTKTLIQSARKAPGVVNTGDVVVDITGGTLTASIGATLAAINANATIEFIEAGKKPDGGLDWSKDKVTIRHMVFDDRVDPGESSLTGELTDEPSVIVSAS